MYYASVPNDVTSVTATAAPNDSAATLQFEDGTPTGTSGQVTRELAVGSNRVKVTITSQDGDSRKTYAIMVNRADTGASTDATLSDLTLEDEDGNSIDILPSPFSSSTTEYTASVASTVSKVTVFANPVDSNAVALIFGEDDTHRSGQRDIDLSFGDNLIRVTVYAEDASTTKTYSLTVTRATSADSADSSLSALTLSTTGGTTLALTPAFDPATTSYAVSVGNSTSAVILSATKSHSGATATIEDSNGTSTPDSASVALGVGSNVVRAVVASEDGNNETTYTVTVTRAASSDATLRSLVLTDDGGSQISLTPVFSSGTGVYEAAVANSVDTVTINVTKNHSGAVPVFVGATETGTSGEATQSLTVGENIVKVMVTAQNNATTKVYMVTVTRAASSDATLSGLTLTDGSSNAISLAPAFTAATTAYTASVGNAISTVTMAATKSHAGATVNVVAPDGTSTPDSAAGNLEAGENVFKAVVTAEDGDTTKEYVVTVTRAASSDASLSSLTLTDGSSNAISLAPAFTADTTAYTASVGNATGTVTMAATKSHSGASVNVVSPDGTSTPDSAAGNLEIGENVFKAVVTAEDGVTESTYEVTVTRAGSTDATLSSLTLTDDASNAISLTPAFTAATTSYTASVGSATSTATMAATKSHTGASVNIVAPDGTSAPDSATANLEVGENVFKAVVTAEDGDTTKEYVVTVTRAASADAILSSLTLTDDASNAISLTPAFTAATTSYTASVGSAISTATLAATKSHGGASVNVVAPDGTSAPDSATANLEVGENVFKAVVTAEDGDTTKEYVVTVTRAASSDATLSGLTLTDGNSNAISLTPAFTAATTSYTASVGNAITTVTVAATKSHTGASVNVVAPDGTSTPDSATGNLEVGENIFKSVVVAEDGETSIEYVVTVTRAASTDATLSGLTLTDGSSNAISLVPNFTAATTAYTASVGNAISTVTVAATKSHTGASVSIVDPDGTSTPDSASVDLEVGENVVKAVVTAEDGVTETTYTITITRDGAVVLAATLTVGHVTSTVPASYGYSLWGGRDGGSLSTERFTIEGVGYRAQLLTYMGGGLFFALNRHLPADFTLKVGDTEYRGSDSLVPVTAGRAEYWWSDEQVTLTGGQAIAVGLTMGQSPLPQLEAAPPTAFFMGVPDSHDGVDAFTFTAHFTDAVSVDAETLRDHTFDVTGGSVTVVTQASSSSTRNWEIEVQPDSGNDVTITLIDASSCEVVGAVCTSDGRQLHNRPSVTVSGPDLSGN